VSTREEVSAQVELALVTLGFSKREARTAIERASARVGLPVDLDTMLRAALRECPK
jgi:Holliday junction resolvasome RuvABC DNA-binding subunit